MSLCDGSVILSEQTPQSWKHLRFTAKKVLGSGGGLAFSGVVMYLACVDTPTSSHHWRISRIVDAKMVPKPRKVNST